MYLSAPLIVVNSAALTHANLASRCNRGVKIVEDVRRARLQELRAEVGSLAELNVLLGLKRNDSTLSQILNQSAGSKSDKPKTMGSAMARALEKACGKPTGWMDTDPEAGWPFELLTRAMFEGATERQKGAIEAAAVKAMQDLGEQAAPPFVPRKHPRRAA